MGGLTGSAGGLSPAQLQQIQSMLKATGAPPSIFAPLTLNAAEQKNFTQLTAIKKQHPLTATQTALLTKLTNRKNTIAATNAASPMNLGKAPERSAAFNLARDARMTILQRQGYKATVATSPHGDAGFGTSLSRPVLTGQAA